MDLAKRSDNSLRAPGDMFYARAYRVIAQRIGVDDFRRLLEEKLAAVRESYQFLIVQYNHSRAFTLEVLVVVILVVELALALLHGQ